MRAYPLDQPNRSFAADDLNKFGVLHWRLPLAGSAAEIARIKQEHGYVDEDEVSLSKETPNLDAICAKFDKEHFHTLDEVRFVVEGEGIFDVRDKERSLGAHRRRGRRPDHHPGEHVPPLLSDLGEEDPLRAPVPQQRRLGAALSLPPLRFGRTSA